MIVDVDLLMESTKMVAELKDEFSKVTKHKISVQDHFYILAMNNK